MSALFKTLRCSRAARLSTPHAFSRQHRQLSGKTHPSASSNNNTPSSRAGTLVTFEKTLFPMLIPLTGLYILGLATIGAAGSLSTVDWSRNTRFNFFSAEDTKSIEGLRKGVLNSIHSRSSTQSLANTGKIDHDTSPANIQAACKEFAAILGAENVSTDQADLITHSGSDYQSYAWFSVIRITRVQPRHRLFDRRSS